MPVSLIKVRPWLHLELRKVAKRADACTCHVPDSSRFGRFDVGAREIVLLRGSSEWQHLDDGTLATTHHAHVERYATDCDGAHGNEYVSLPLPGEDDWDFWQREVGFAISAYRPGTLEITERGNNLVATWSAATDEGHENETRVRCFDPHCAYDKGSQYDQFAELMGY